MIPLRAPIRANLEITEACPLACEHCYNFWRYQHGDRNSRDDGLRTVEHFSAILDALVAQRIPVVTITGGEPFLRRDVLFTLIDQAHAAGTDVLVNTNAALIGSRDVESPTLRKVSVFLVSLMSASEVVHNKIASANSHFRTLRGIRLLTSAGHRVAVNMVVSQRNASDVRETAQLAADLGAEAFSATPMLPCEIAEGHISLQLSPTQIVDVFDDLLWVRENVPIAVTVLDTVVHCLFNDEQRSRFEMLLGERYCCAGISDCAISADANLRPCLLSTEVGGNILTDGWDLSWKKLSRWRDASILPADCRACGAVDICGGGCRAAARAWHGRDDAPDPYMTGPLEAPPPNARRVRERLAPQAVPVAMRIADGVLLRPEDFGGAAFLSGTGTFLRQDGYHVLSELAGRTFSVSDIANSFNCPREEVEEFVSRLTADGILQAATHQDE